MLGLLRICAAVKMTKPALRFLLRRAVALAFLGCVLAVSGCAGKNKGSDNYVELKDPPDVIYNQALANMDAGRMKEASKKFAAIDRQYPYSEWARKAQVMGAYSYYKQKKYTDSINMAKRYIALYPTSNETAYAYYVVGLSYFKQISDVTHDQGDSARAADALQEVVNRFPKSEYVGDAKVKIRFAREQMAGKEMQIGRYYLEQKQFLAAIKRFRYVVEKYSNTNQVEEALYRLVEANYAMGIVTEAQAAGHVLAQNYPQSPWYKMAYKLLQKQGLSPKADSSGWLSKIFGGSVLTAKKAEAKDNDSADMPSKKGALLTQGEDIAPDAAVRGSAVSASAKGKTGQAVKSDKTVALLKK